jgi:hypothetical protein
MKLNKIKISKKENFEFCKGGFLIYLIIDRKNDSLKFITTVFSEKSFIPLSIRNCVSKVKDDSNKKKYPAFLEIDEKRFCVNLVQFIPGNSKMSLLQLKKLFVFVSRSWAVLLKRIASQDLLAL